MDELPLAVLAPEDERDPQRPVLGWMIADLAVLPLDDDEDDEVARGVGLDDLERGLARLEEPRHLGQVLLRLLEAVDGVTAGRRHERVVVGVLDQGHVPAHVTVDEGRRRPTTDAMRSATSAPVTRSSGPSCPLELQRRARCRLTGARRRRASGRSNARRVMSR
jgi:hypothetical protein